MGLAGRIRQPGLVPELHSGEDIGCLLAEPAANG